MATHKTHADVMLQIIEETISPEARVAFARDMLPNMKLSERAKQPITEEEFEMIMAQMRPELPHFAQALLDWGS